ncbi:MAG: hypothetical protein RLZZ453_667 [Chlamydiota bacterium]|jgi:hypothetical protein
MLHFLMNFFTQNTVTIKKGFGTIRPAHGVLMNDQIEARVKDIDNRFLHMMRYL